MTIPQRSRKAWGRPERQKKKRATLLSFTRLKPFRFIAAFVIYTRMLAMKTGPFEPFPSGCNKFFMGIVAGL